MNKYLIIFYPLSNLSLSMSCDPIITHSKINNEPFYNENNSNFYEFFLKISYFPDVSNYDIYL